MENSKKINKVPYFRMWANIFNYNGITKRKEFIVDFLIHIAFCCILFFVMKWIGNFVGDFYVFIILLSFLLCFLPFLSLATRRIRDTGNPPLLSFLSLSTVAIILVVILCLFESKDAIEPKKFKAKNTKRILALFLTMAVIITLPPVLLFSSLAFDIFFLQDGKTTYLNTNIEDYEKEIEDVENAKKMMPELEELQGYSNIQMAAQEKIYSTFLGFYSNSVSLYVTYEEKFLQEKENIAFKYNYLSEPIYIRDRYESLAASFSYNGYDYRVVLDEDYANYCAAKSFMVVGVNDIKQQIAYHYFYDFDLDYIAEGFEDLDEQSKHFMETNFYYFKD